MAEKKPWGWDSEPEDDGFDLDSLGASLSAPNPYQTTTQAQAPAAETQQPPQSFSGTSPQWGAGGGTVQATDPWASQITGAYQQYLGRDPEAGALDQYAGQSAENVVRDVQGSKEAQGYATVGKYQTQFDQLKQTTDPGQQALLKDKIQRDLFSELKTAGHDVKWQGDQLLIDGRAYEFAWPTAAAGPSAAPAGGGSGLAFSGFNFDRAQDPTTSAKDAFASAAQASGTMPRTHEDAQAWFLHYAKPALEQQGFTVHQVVGDKAFVSTRENPGGEWIDFLQDAGGANPMLAWQSQAAGAGGGGSPTSAPTRTPGTAGAAGTATGGLAAATNTAPAWSPRASSYTPGAIGEDDLPTLTADELLAQMGGYTPSPIEGGYEFGGFQGLPELGPQALDPAVEALMARILTNPESLDARTIDMMKGASADALAAGQRSDEEALIGLANQLGVADSNWAASERIGSRRERDAALNASNRGIDLEAAKTNQGDRLAAANLGASYTDARARRTLAERGQLASEQIAGEGLKLSGAQLQAQIDQYNQDNVFRAADLQTRQVLGATEAQLSAAAARTDRLALRETIQQKAAELNLDADKLMTDWLVAQMDNNTRLQLAQMGYDIDLRKLQQAGQEFKEDLAFRIMALKQEDQQFAAQYGLSLADFERLSANDEWNRYMDLQPE